MTAHRAPPTSWRPLLAGAITTPGRIHEAYQRFHRYSLHNQLLALSQCEDRGITPGPLRTFKGWQALGRNVRRDEKALILCAPMTRRDDDEDAVFGFALRARWFTLSQTDGDAYTEVDAPTWSEELALATLDIMLLRIIGTLRCLGCSSVCGEGAETSKQSSKRSRSRDKLNRLDRRRGLS